MSAAGGLQLPVGSAEAALAEQLPGSSAGEKLVSALTVIANMQREMEQLQGRNRALAEDLIRLTSSSSGAVGGGAKTPPTGGGGDLEARVAAQLRASRAEMEAGTLRWAHKQRERGPCTLRAGVVLHAPGLWGVIPSPHFCCTPRRAASALTCASLMEY